MGKNDVVMHCKSKSHLEQAKALDAQAKLPFQPQSTSDDLKRTEAELRMAVLTATSNVPMAFHDHLSPTIRKVFPDSKIALKYHSASTKATCILNEAVAPTLISDLLENMRVHPFSISIDGSNDSDLEKMNPITVRIYDCKCNMIVNRFLNMCTTTSATAEGIYTAMNTTLQNLLSCPNPWSLCTAVGVDNTSVNIGIRDSIKTRVLRQNPAVYFNGCPCHIIHNAAQKAGESFTGVSGFDVEEFVIDLFYWFDKSTKRKNGLQSYCTFCNQDYRSIVKHVSTRWLSLEVAVQRSLKQLASLTSYFKSENESQARFRRLQTIFTDPMTEVFLLFFQSVLPSFTHCNQFLQREEPLIHVLRPQLEKLLKNVLGKFIKPEVIAEGLKNVDGLLSVDYMNTNNHVTDDKMVIGFVTKQTVNRLLAEGDISAHKLSTFYNATRAFFIRATEYLLKWCPLKDELLINATWLDFENRLQKSFPCVEYFVLKYQHIFSGMNIDELNEQFLDYQLLPDDAIPKEVKECVNLSEEDPHRIDVLWGFLQGVKKPGTNLFDFDLLFKVAEAVMTIPHSNAGEERIFP